MASEHLSSDTKLVTPPWAATYNGFERLRIYMTPRSACVQWYYIILMSLIFALAERKNQRQKKVKYLAAAGKRGLLQSLQPA
jgi:hypothetical protein